VQNAAGMSFPRLATADMQTSWNAITGYANPRTTVKKGEIEMGPSVLDPYTTKRSLSPKEQAELMEIFGVTPVKSITVSLCGGTGTTYYDSDGNKVGSFHKGAGYRYESLGTYYDKDGNMIRREGTALSAQEQQELTKIFGVTPVTVVESTKSHTDSWQPIVGAPTTLKYFDKDGNFVGRKVYNPSTGSMQASYYDKDGKKIETNTDSGIQPPAQPDKNEKDIKVWINYVKDLIAYIFNKFDRAGSPITILRQGNV